MSAQQMLAVLRDLGYPKAGKLDPKGLEWMFENDAMLPFLEWFCNSISAANVLTKEEMEQFHSLESAKESILEGEQLDQALKNLKVSQNEQVPVAQLEQEVEQLRENLERCRTRKQSLIQKRNKLSLHHTSLSHRQSKLSQTEARVKSQYKRSLEQNKTDNDKVNSSLEHLAERVGQLSEIYELPVQEKSKEAVPMFLSQLALDEYYLKEEKFSQELSLFTKKKFFEGIADVAGQSEGSRYEILEISDPNLSLIRGVGQEVNISQCKELSRIKKSYPAAKLKHIEAKIASVQSERRLETAEDILKTVQAGEFSKDCNSINKRLSDADSSLQMVQRELESLGGDEVPGLIQDSMSSQVSHILTGDYNLKLARQDYFISNQDQVIHPLVQQRARNEFLTMAFELENRNHRDIHRLLVAVKQLLHNHLKGWQARMKMMEDPLLTTAKYKRSTIDSRDSFAKRLHQVLEVENTEHIFLTYASLENGAEKLKHCYSVSCSHAETVRDSKEELLEVLEQNVQSCEEMIYSRSSTTHGQPSLTPPELQSTMMQLEGMLGRLESAIKDTVRNLEQKKQILKSDPLLYKERKLFMYFFTNPACLRQLFDEMSSRLQAQKLQ
ncbi:HAUS augmin-like complex subunit 3 [Saccostrea cucullata]|uniref:HAUS augmin-like complex subunit 3 n=1 Tax=Saccostrea cuccullata TaxID=36930 RepID=UPI002ED4394C